MSNVDNQTDTSVTFTKASIDQLLAVVNEMPHKFAKVIVGILQKGVVQDVGTEVADSSDDPE